jgi:hypothetical protein
MRDPARLTGRPGTERGHGRLALANGTATQGFPNEYRLPKPIGDHLAILTVPCFFGGYRRTNPRKYLTMTIFGILSSPSQRRSFLLASGAVLLISIIAILYISYYFPNTPIWNALNSMLISIVASGVFALVSCLYISYFFMDPNDIETKSTLLPQDIDQALKDIALKAADYKIFVRTGRHFRAEILPLLVRQARGKRCPIRMEVVLLDFREKAVCKKYANFRKTSSFDRQLWDTQYVQKEVLATILALITVTNDNRDLVDIDLFLSTRLSTFRIEGSSDEILITREDPKDTASRYLRAHRDFSAFVSEFSWIRDEAYKVPKESGGGLPAALPTMFPENADDIVKLASLVGQALRSGSPYVR